MKAFGFDRRALEAARPSIGRRFWLGMLCAGIATALNLGVVVTPALAGTQLPTRTALRALIGGMGTLESFERFIVASGNSALLATTTLDSTTVTNGQGPGLVVAGVTLGSPGNLQWNGNNYFSLSTRTINGGANPLVVDFAAPAAAFGVDLSAFSGHPYTAVVTVFAADDTTVLYGPLAVSVAAAPSRTFFGYEEATGIGRVELRNQNQTQYSAIIDDLEFSACGNGVVDAAFGEQCEDGNRIDGDGCDSNCTLTACGNGIVAGTVAAAEQCDDGNTLAGDCCSSTCQYEANGAPCTSDGLPCSADVCNATGTCTHGPSPSGTLCRASAGTCDLAETCNGTATSCPTDRFAASGVCRAAADACDAAESCDGGGPNCPTDRYRSSGVCRAAAGVCDAAESCDGSGIACPPDAKSTSVCRAAADACDVAESCDGISDACPADGFALAGTVCRADAGDCDVAEACSGLNAACPADAREADGTACDDGDTCTLTDSCQAGICSGADRLDCDDGDGCTADICDPAGFCINDDAPATGCLAAAQSFVLIKHSSDDPSRDRLLWKWRRGEALSQMDLADPTADTSYALCVYAGTANALVGDASLPPGPSWSELGAKGYKFKGRSPDGIAVALLKGGAAGKSSALVNGRGAALPDQPLPVAYPVTVQLKKDGSPLCLESTFTDADEVRNTTTQFKAKQ